MTSRVAKNPVNIPAGVDIALAGQNVTVKGKHGELKLSIHPAIQVTKEEKALRIVILENSPQSDALAGTTRALLNNLVKGAHEGFIRKLILVGVGYRAKAQGKNLSLSLGFSHPVELEMPEGIAVETPTQTEIILKGANKQMVNQMAANIRSLRPPEPYKGKGIRYENEQITLKEGKKK